MRAWLKALRIKRGLTQGQLGLKSNVSRTMIAKIESGAANPHIETAKRIAAVLGFDWTEFYKTKSSGQTGKA